MLEDLAPSGGMATGRLLGAFLVAGYFPVGKEFNGEETHLRTSLGGGSASLSWKVRPTPYVILELIESAPWLLSALPIASGIPLEEM